jgi:hypothetical protein
MALWSSALHRSASCATRDSGFAPRLCRSRSRPGWSVGRRTIGLASSGLGRVWPVGISLSHLAPATPVAGKLTKVARCTVFPPCLSGWLPGWMRCDKKQCGLVGLCFGGRMAFDLCLSQACTGVVAMRQDSNY